MRYADSATLIVLNDQAVVADFNEWLTARFFDDVATPGRHVLALAIPHGIRPGSERPEWPPHFRTLWYAETAGGGTERVKLDVRADDLYALPEIPGTRSDNPFGPGPVELPPFVVVETDSGLWILDGKHVHAAALEVGYGEDFQGLRFPDVSETEIAAARAAIADAPGDEWKELRERVTRRMMRAKKRRSSE